MTPARHWLAELLLVGLTCVGILPLSAQDTPAPNRGGFTVSMGIPPTWRWSLGFSARTHRKPGEAHVAFYGTGGFSGDIRNLMTASLGIIGEACECP